MSFIHDIDFVLVLNSHSFRIYNPYSSESYAIDFPPSALDNQEIINKDEFEKIITEFIESKKLYKKRALIVLSEELIFEKKINTDDFDKDKSIIDKFFQTVPFADYELGKEIVRDRETTNLFAANKIIYGEIIKILMKNKWELLAVIPINIFPSLKGVKELNKEMLETIINNKRLIKGVNFMNKEDFPRKNNLNIYSIISILFIIGTIFFVILSIFKFIGTPKLLDNKISPSPTIYFSTPTAISINIKEYSINILNGSGKDGEASLLKTKLEKIGYSISDIGNADKNNYTRTKLSAKSNVNKEFLNKLQNDIDLKTSSETAILNDKNESDVVIIIGLDE